MDLDCAHAAERIQNWLKDKVDEAGADGAVIGLSGGIDSAVTSVLCRHTFPDHTLGLILPCYSSEDDAADARLVADKFDIDYKLVNLDDVFDLLLDRVRDKESNNDRMAAANIKPRLRMTVLYYYAARNNYLVVGTDNWSELKVGYFTKYGDGGVDIAPLGRLVKTEVRQLARYLNIPQKIIEKKPSAGLWKGQTDEDELGISYEVLDDYILTGKADPETARRIDGLAEKNAHKLEPVPTPDRKELQPS